MISLSLILSSRFFWDFQFIRFMLVLFLFIFVNNWALNCCNCIDKAPLIVARNFLFFYFFVLVRLCIVEFLFSISTWFPIDVWLTLVHFPFCPNSQGPHQRRTPRAVHLGSRSLPEHDPVQVQAVLQRAQPGRLRLGQLQSTATERFRTYHKGKRRSSSSGHNRSLLVSMDTIDQKVMGSLPGGYFFLETLPHFLLFSVTQQGSNSSAELLRVVEPVST